MSQRVLLIKLTSMGDLIHTLPALTDAAQAFPGIEFDWVVDEAFAEIPTWHPNVHRVIKSAHRRWKKNIRLYWRNGELRQFYQALNNDDYDVILDTQNNLKSAVITWLRRGHSHGLDKSSVREKPAHWAYRYQHCVDNTQHAITRQRQIFAKVLKYPLPQTAPNCGIDSTRFSNPNIELPKRYLVFVHNASWTTKLWPQQHWYQLIAKAQNEGYHVLLPCGNEEELLRAQQLAKDFSHAIALPKMSLSEIASIINNASGAVCCDTGLAHIASMLNIPTVSFYGPTDHHLIGAIGLNQYHCVSDTTQFPCAPCYKKQCDFRTQVSVMAACMEAFTPDEVWSQLQLVINPDRVNSRSI